MTDSYQGKTKQRRDFILMLKQQVDISSNQALFYVCVKKRGALCKANFPMPIYIKYLEQTLTIHVYAYCNQNNIQEIFVKKSLEWDNLNATSLKLSMYVYSL